MREIWEGRRGSERLKQHHFQLGTCTHTHATDIADRGELSSHRAQRGAHDSGRLHERHEIRQQASNSNALNLIVFFLI